MCWVAALSFSLAPIASSAQDLVFLSPKDHVIRIAMDVLGTRPSEADLNTTAGDIPALVDRYMETEEFGKRMMWLANDIFLTRTDFVEYFQDSYEYDERRIRYQVAKAVGEEPLRLFEYIVTNDLPLTELVAADYTVANSTLAFFWNIEYAGDYYSDQWMRGRYLDGRQHAGVLSQTSFYYRYNQTNTNKQRHRANTITTLLVGDDHLLRNVQPEFRIADPDLDLLDQTLKNPSCTVCHSSMDGIGAHVNGFAIGPDEHSVYARETFTTYSQQAMERAQMEINRLATYYGYPSNGLKDLGNYMAKDPRFARTMVKHFYKFLLHRDLDYRDRDLITGYTELLQNNNYSPKTLIRAIVTSDEYRAGGAVGASSKSKTPAAADKTPIEDYTFVKTWIELEKTVKEADLPKDRKDQLVKMAHVHQREAGKSIQVAKTMGHLLDPKATGIPVDPAPASEIVQPFKITTPEQLHALGLQLMGEQWAGGEGGQEMPSTFPHLEYNTGVKVAAGGYDGGLILTRRWDVPPTYLLVFERWAEVLAEDIYQRELRESIPWGERKVFKLITGKEDPLEAEPTVRMQIANWFLLFYGDQVDPFGPEVSEVFDLLLKFSGRDGEGEGDKTYSSGQNTDVRIAWQRILELMLTDPKIATY
jgi:hypothetical protein